MTESGTTKELEAPRDNQYIGKPCKRGHAGLRWKEGRNCVECHREQDRKRKREKYRTDPTYREKRRERGARRLRMFGTRMIMPDMEFHALAVKLREDRRNA